MIAPKRIQLRTFVLVLVLFAAPVGAQDGPHGPVEACSAHYMQSATLECEMCSVPAASPKTCSEKLGPLGFERKCRTRGDHAGYGEVWCLDQSKLKATNTRTLAIAGLAGLMAVAGAFWFVQRARRKRAHGK
jgi:hypothetical protein